MPPPEEKQEEINPYKGWGALEKRQKAISMSERTRGSKIVSGIKLSPDFDIVQQLASGLANNWARLSWLFERWDVDGSGMLSERELHYAMTELGLSAHPQAIDKFFRLMDVDQSGEVSYDEVRPLRAPSLSLLWS